MILVVVLGYGCQVYERYTEYFHQVGKYVAGCLDRGAKVTVLVSGGFTNPRECPGVSEAEIGIDLIREAISTTDVEAKGRITFVAEDLALTTSDNLRQIRLWVAKLMSQRSLVFNDIVIYHDMARGREVRNLARYELGVFARETDASIECRAFDFDYPPSTVRRQKWLGFLKILSRYLPWLAQRAHDRRIVDWVIRPIHTRIERKGRSG